MCESSEAFESAGRDSLTKQSRRLKCKSWRQRRPKCSSCMCAMILVGPAGQLGPSRKNGLHSRSANVPGAHWLSDTHLPACRYLVELCERSRNVRTACWHHAWSSPSCRGRGRRTSRRVSVVASNTALAGGYRPAKHDRRARIVPWTDKGRRAGEKSKIREMSAGLGQAPGHERTAHDLDRSSSHMPTLQHTCPA